MTDRPPYAEAEKLISHEHLCPVSVYFAKPHPPSWCNCRVLKVAAALRDAELRGAEKEREACARVAEEHPDHIDFSRGDDGDLVQQHMEPPYICNVARAIRARSSPRPAKPEQEKA